MWDLGASFSRLYICKMYKNLKTLFKADASGMFKGMLTLLVGAGLARLLGLISIPILARVYEPEDFGVLALYNAFVFVLVPVMSLRYVQAIPLPRTDVMAFNLVAVCLKLIFISSLIMVGVLLVWGEEVFVFFDVQSLLPWWWLVVVGASGAALYEVFSLWATRKKQYKVIAKTQVYQSLLGNLIKIGLGLLDFKSVGLILGQIVSQSAGITSLTKKAGGVRVLCSKVEYKKELLIVRYYKGFFWFRLPSQILMVLSIQAPVMMMAALYGKEITGQLSLAMLALALPVGLVGNAMAKAYYAEIAEIGKRNINKIKELTLAVQRRLFFVGAPVFVVIYFCSEFLFRVLFGEEWGTAGLFASLLAPFILFQLTSSPLMEVVNVLGIQAFYLVLHGVRVFGLFLVFMAVRHYSIGAESFVAILSFYLSFFYLLASVLVVLILFRVSNKVE